MAVNRDALVSGENLSALLIICLEFGPILDALCLAQVKNSSMQIETADRHSSLKLSRGLDPWGNGQETPKAMEVQRLQGLSLLLTRSVAVEPWLVCLVKADFKRIMLSLKMALNK